MARKTYRLQLVLVEVTIPDDAEGEERRTEVGKIEVLVNEDLKVARRKMYRIDRLITHAAFI